MKANLSIKYLVLIVIGAIAMATIIYVGNNLVEGAMQDAFETAFD